MSRTKRLLFLFWPLYEILLVSCALPLDRNFRCPKRFFVKICFINLIWSVLILVLSPYLFIDYEFHLEYFVYISQFPVYLAMVLVIPLERYKMKSQKLTGIELTLNYIMRHMRWSINLDLCKRNFKIRVSIFLLFFLLFGLTYSTNARHFICMTITIYIPVIRYYFSLEHFVVYADIFRVLYDKFIEFINRPENDKIAFAHFKNLVIYRGRIHDCVTNLSVTFAFQLLVLIFITIYFSTVSFFFVPLYIDIFYGDPNTRNFILLFAFFSWQFASLFPFLVIIFLSACILKRVSITKYIIIILIIYSFAP